MPTLEDLIGSESRAKLNDIVKPYKEAERDKRLKQYKAEQEAKRRYVEATHFKTAQEMIDWVMSGNTIYSEYGDKMELDKCPDPLHVGRYGQQTYDGLYFWEGWNWVSIDEWVHWVNRIAEPGMLEFGYLPTWGKIPKWKYEEENENNASQD